MPAYLGLRKSLRLHVIQTRIFTVASHEILVCPEFADLALLHAAVLPCQSDSDRIGEERTTHIMISAYFVRCPNRWETNIIVLPSPVCRSRSKSSNSPRGSSALDGSSTLRSLICCVRNRINVRELMYPPVSRPQRMENTNTYATSRCFSPPARRSATAACSNIQVTYQKPPSSSPAWSAHLSTSYACRRRAGTQTPS